MAEPLNNYSKEEISTFWGIHYSIPHIGAHHLNDLLNVFVSGRVGQDGHHLVQKYH